MIGALIGKLKVRFGFSYLNDRNMEKFLSLWSENAIFTYPGNLSVSGTKNGKEEVKKWFDNLMNNGPSVHFALQSVCVNNIFDIVGNNIVTVEWDNSITNRNGLKMLVKGVSVIRIKFGKIVEVRDYIFEFDKIPLVWCEEPKT